MLGVLVLALNFALWLCLPANAIAVGDWQAGAFRFKLYVVGWDPAIIRQRRNSGANKPAATFVLLKIRLDFSLYILDPTEAFQPKGCPRHSDVF